MRFSICKSIGGVVVTFFRIGYCIGADLHIVNKSGARPHNQSLFPALCIKQSYTWKGFTRIKIYSHPIIVSTRLVIL